MNKELFTDNITASDQIQTSYNDTNIKDYGYKALFGFLLLTIIFQNELLYMDFKRNILNENRYIPSDSTIGFFDKVKENLKISTSHLRKGKILYRARVTDDKFNANFAKLIIEKIIGQETGEFDFSAIENIDFEIVFSLLALLDEKEYAINAEEFISEYSKRQFQGYDAIASNAPPASISKEGRLNPARISYLYTAEDISTSVHEVKPFIGQTVSIAKLRTLKTLKVLDLTKDFPIDIHKGNDGSELPYKNIMDIISDVFKTPNYNDPLEYVPTQYFTEYIKEIQNYDGIKFWSSLKKGGKNIVIFNPTLCEVVSSKLITVNDIKLKYQNFF